MVGVIAAILVAVWFFSTAERSGRPQVSWAISGVVVYFLAALLWSLIVTPTLKDSAIHNQSGHADFYGSLCLYRRGLLAAAAVNFWLNKPAE
jgi:hypothetical protein